MQFGGCLHDNVWRSQRWQGSHYDNVGVSIIPISNCCKIRWSESFYTPHFLFINTLNNISSNETEIINNQHFWVPLQDGKIQLNTAHMVIINIEHGADFKHAKDIP